jgi:hypothetical protein
MSYILVRDSVEDRVKRDFGMDFLPFAQKCKDEGLGAHDIAEMLGCSLSNLRRILRKFRFSFVVVKREPLLTDCPRFKNKRINTVNCLSRRWVP